MLDISVFGTLLKNCHNYTKKVTGVILMSWEEFLEGPCSLPVTQNEGKCGPLSICILFCSNRDAVFHNNRKSSLEIDFPN